MALTLRYALSAARVLGFDIQHSVRSVRNTPRYIRDLLTYRAAARRVDCFPLSISNLQPMLAEYDGEAGTADGHYFFQDLWAARKIYEAHPKRHVDVGSRIDGFVAHLLVFMPVEVVDIRPLSSSVSNLSFIQDDATSLASMPSDSVESLSSLHAVEHFGLGRYGDPVAPDGWQHGMRSLARVLAPGGRLYFSVPIGSERVHFNAHRIFSPNTVLHTLSNLELVSFAAVDDFGRFCSDARPSEFASARLACGLFEFAKPKP